MPLVENPIRHSPRLGRELRQDGVETLGTSTQTLAEGALEAGRWELAEALIRYFWDEMARIGEALYVWQEDIIGYRLAAAGLPAGDEAHVACRLVAGLRDFDVGEGDRVRAIAACRAGDAPAAADATELMRLRWAAVHDALVAWIQETLAGLAEDCGEEAVLHALERAYERLWKPRYDGWTEWTPIERLQLSAEGMRGHLSGRRRRGDVEIVDEGDRFVMVLDPCGSCGILRRGDPESGRPPQPVKGNARPHPWTWGRTGVGWYCVHSPIVMEYLWTRRGLPPMRPHKDCDRDLPCRWYVWKDPSRARPLEAPAVQPAAIAHEDITEVG